MTPDTINIANGSASALLLKHQGKNLISISSQKLILNSGIKSVSGKIETAESISQKSLFEINKSQSPLNKPIESNSNSLKGMLYSDISHKQDVIQYPNTSSNIISNSDVVVTNSEVTNPALIEQGGWFVTIVPDKRTSGGFLQLTEKRDDRKENLKEFYNPTVKFNKGKLLDIVG